MAVQHTKHVRSITALITLVLIAAASTAGAQALIKVNDQVNLKFGVLFQPQADWLKDAATNGYSQNLFIRRARILMAGQVAPNITFFAETDSPNFGKTVSGAKNTQPTMYLQDAYVNYKFSDAVSVDAGLMLISTNRNGLQSAASLLPIDYGAYTFSNSAPTQSNVGRDTGAQLRGYLAKNHFEYRAGIFQGVRDAKSRNSFRKNMRVQYNFFDTETGYFYTGTYLGKKKILSIGGGYEQQQEYKNYAADVFFDQPVGKNAITAQVDVVRFDGGKFITALPRQTDTLLEAGYFISALKISPVVQYTKRDRVGSVGDETRTFIGLDYWRLGHNANLKAGYTNIKPKGSKNLNELTVQLQFFYF